MKERKVKNTSDNQPNKDTLKSKFSNASKAYVVKHT